MIRDKYFHIGMKKILYFLIISFVFVGPAMADNTYDMANIEWCDFAQTYPGYVYHYLGYYPDASEDAFNAVYNAVGSSPTMTNYQVDGNYVLYGYAKTKYVSSEDNYHVYYAIYYVHENYADSVYDSTTQVADSDGDGIPDNFDLKPNSSDSYKAAIVSVCYDANNKVVAGVIQDGEGNQYSFGTMPTDFEGYTIDSVTGDFVTYQTAEDLAASLAKLDIDDLNITKQNTPVEIQDDGTIIPGTTDPFKDYRAAEDDQTKAKKPETQEAPSEQPDSSDDDSGRMDKIIKNTASTNTNLDNIQKYLGITNDYLAKINDKTGTTSSTSSGGAVVTVTTPTADEIGQAVEDQLIDSGQTIDKTITDNISDLDETDTLTTIKTKYSDRYDLFITTLKESDLFSLPFGIFSGPSGSGSSIQTVDIGKWGSSSEQTASIDYSDYDNIWQILRSVLLLVTSFACFKILVLKKA